MPNTPTALIIIDMQIGMSLPTAGERNNPTAEKNIATLLTLWRQEKQPIIHIRHISRSLNSSFYPNQPSADFQPELAPLPHEHVVEKNVPDAFIQSGLERWLHQRNIKSLVIVGVSTNNSVEATVRSAGNLGFNTIVINDATFAFAKHDYSGRPRTAEEVHDMSLANLDDEYAKIMTTEKLIKDMEK
ncbi:cysteine hydrolase family protein [Aquirhabdus parva]|uniref:cysteine hydrolase family protein n=1 Tax=Aquirhabdus parva TaxID=2283318 RepID=UPI001D18678A|nr:cysteine hydrolase family protein [Aquirhabdus parva]